MHNNFLEINALGIALFSIILITNRTLPRVRETVGYLNAVIILTIFTQLSELTYFWLEGLQYDQSVLLSYFLIFIYFSTIAISCYLWFSYIMTELYGKSETIFSVVIIKLIPLFIVLIVLATSSRSHAIFYISSDNFYHRGQLFLLQPIFSYIYIVASIICCFSQYFKELLQERKNMCLKLGFCLLVTLAGGIGQTFQRSLNLAIPSIILTIIVLYIEDIKQLAIMDPLTGLNNRGQFDNYLDAKLKTNYKKDVYLIMIDIDKFKLINDKFGHVEGDKAVVIVANTFKKVFSSTGAFISRYGGDEFAIVLESNEEEVADVCEKMNIMLKLDSEELPYDLEISLGYAKFDNCNMEDAVKLVDEVDKTMYANKAKKKEMSQDNEK